MTCPVSYKCAIDRPRFNYLYRVLLSVVLVRICSLNFYADTEYKINGIEKQYKAKMDVNDFETSAVSFIKLATYRRATVMN